MWPFKRTDTKLDQASTVLNPFVAMTIKGFDLNSTKNLPARRLAECYVYGAIRYLASYDDMKPSSTNSLFESILGEYFSAGNKEIEECQGYLRSIKPGGNEQLFMIEGASALRRMLVNNDQSSGKNLQMLLDKVLPR